jgi:hypothetical protein
MPALSTLVLVTLVLVTLVLVTPVLPTLGLPTLGLPTLVLPTPVLPTLEVSTEALSTPARPIQACPTQAPQTPVLPLTRGKDLAVMQATLPAILPRVAAALQVTTGSSGSSSPCSRVASRGARECDSGCCLRQRARRNSRAGDSGNENVAPCPSSPSARIAVDQQRLVNLLSIMAWRRATSVPSQLGATTRLSVALSPTSRDRTRPCVSWGGRPPRARARSADALSKPNISGVN